jgi:hypothetical protein
MDLTVELHAEINQGAPVMWVAHTNRFHFPGWNGTAMGSGISPHQALAELHKELERIAKGAIVSPERVEGTLTRTEHVHQAFRFEPEGDMIFCQCGAWRLQDSPHWKQP